MIKRRPDEFQYDALKLAKKTFVLEVESFSITQFEKCFYIFSPEKEKKSNFLVKSALTLLPVTAER